MSFGPISFLTPQGSRSGALAELRPRLLQSGLAIPQFGNSRKTLPYGEYWTFDNVSGVLDPGNPILPSKLNTYFGRISSGSTAPNIVQLSGVNGSGIALKAGLSDTAFLSGVTGASRFTSWTVAGWFQYIATFSQNSTSNANLTFNNLNFNFAFWDFRFEFSEIGGTQLLRGELRLGAQSQIGLPAITEEHSIAVAFGNWVFGAFRLVRETGQITLRLNDNVFNFSTLIPEANMFSGGTGAGTFLNIGISSGVRNPASFTVGFDELGFWPRALTDAEIGELRIAPVWPNLPAFPR